MNKNLKSFIIENVGSVVSIFVVMLFIFIRGCCAPILWQDKTGTEELLNSLGYNEVEFTGYGWFKCSDDDFYQTGFIVTDPSTEEQLSGTVCDGLIFKGSTIRWDKRK